MGSKLAELSGFAPRLASCKSLAGLHADAALVAASPQAVPLLVAGAPPSNSVDGSLASAGELLVSAKALIVRMRSALV